MRSFVSLLSILIQVYSFLFLARALLSWTGMDPYHPVAQILVRLTEPVLAPIRRIMPDMGMMDFSPMVAMILVQVLGQILISFLR